MVNESHWRQDEASHPATSTQRLIELSAEPSLRCIVAANPATPENLLAQLAQDQGGEVRKAVAGNPNTPWQTLEKLAWEFPHEFLHNPRGPLQMMVHLEQISTDGSLWGALLREASLPPLWWNWLRSHAVLCTHSALRLHVQSAGDASSFAPRPQEEEEGVLLILATLLTAACAQGVTLPSIRKPDQSTTPGTQIIRAYLRRLAHSADKWVREAAASNRQIPVMLLHSLAQDRAENVRHSVAYNKQTPVELLHILAQDRAENVRRGVAANPSASVELLHILAQDEEEDVRIWVADNPNTPVELLHILAQDEEEDVRIWVADNPNTPVELLCTLVQDEDRVVRSTVAANPRTPVELLYSLVQDEDKEVRCRVALNERTPVELLHSLTQDRAENVQRIAKFVLRLLVEVEGLGHEERWRNKLSKFSRRISNGALSSIEDQLKEVAELNVAEPIRQAIIAALAADWDATMIQHAFSRGSGLEWKCYDLVYNTRWEDIMAVSMPPIALRKLAASPSWEVRYLVALHPRTPWEIRQHLSWDGNRYVRAMARAAKELVPESARD